MKIRNKYLVEAIVFMSYVLFAMAWVGGTASMSQIMSSMQLDSYASASFISGAVTFAKIVGTFMAAWLAIKFGVKVAFFISGLLVVLGIFTPLAQDYEWLLVSRFLMGLGGALMIVYFNPIVMNWFSLEERSTINGLNAVAFNVGTAIILTSMVSINELTGNWQNSLVLFSIISLVLIVIWLFVDDQPTTAQTSSQNTVSQDSEQTYGYVDGLKDPFNWAYSLCYAGLLAFYICLFTFYPKAGVSESSVVIGFGIVGTIAGMIYSKRIKQRVSVIKWSGLIVTLMVFTLSFVSSESIQALAAMVLGFFIFFPITALVSIPHELPKMTSNKITVVFSLFWSISYLFATVVLWLFGKIVDMNNGDFQYAFGLIAMVSSTLFLGSFFLPETNPKPNKNSISNDSNEQEA
ncbi:MFS transporter [Psychrosphaera ytuae]|uniref:MFS transporter n=1 Tax=Psychrosphaera ytuae TaxID=2820710 RepID=A0A975DC78_9GAMM|nr:MFS transporter [Psychrosphaera ytuae]QTH64475.1 MFS transporter [Psychrosphaera ytuae]